MSTHRYQEKPAASVPYRERQLSEINAFIKKERKDADARRATNFCPTTTSIAVYEKDCRKLRKSYLSMLGYPLTHAPADLPPLHAKSERVASDDICTIDRLHIPALKGLNTYGILFMPHGVQNPPLVIAQHGGQGTPELVAGFDNGSANYNDMIYRLLKHKVAVFAPQTLLWMQDGPDQRGPKFDRTRIDAQLKQLGGSITALEVFMLRRAVDYFQTRKDINARQMGMIGLSYGGFYTLFTAAAEPRIKAAVSSCFFNDRYLYDWTDWTWNNAANTFLDPEVASLICPRPLWIEVGIMDELFAVKNARREVKKVAARYLALGLGERFHFKAFSGGHELDKDDAAIRFLVRNIIA